MLCHFLCESDMYDKESGVDTQYSGLSLCMQYV